MGYTHYWKLHRSHPAWPEVYGRTALDTATVILPWAESAGITLAGWDGEPGTDPECTEGAIVLNGSGQEDSCETFRIDALAGPPRYQGHDPDRDFCKTRRRPYDTVVLLVLLRLQAHAHAAGTTVEVWSDGSNSGGFDAARSAYADLFGTDAPEGP